MVHHHCQKWQWWSITEETKQVLLAFMLKTCQRGGVELFARHWLSHACNLLPTQPVEMQVFARFVKLWDEVLVQLLYRLGLEFLALGLSFHTEFESGLVDFSITKDKSMQFLITGGRFYWCEQEWKEIRNNASCFNITNKLFIQLEKGAQ